MKKVVVVFALLLCFGRLFCLNWTKKYTLDAFGDRDGHFVYESDALEGTYRNEFNQSGKLTWTMIFSDEGHIFFDIHEDKNKNISITSKGPNNVSTSEELDIQIKVGNEVFQFYGTVQKDEKYVYDRMILYEVSTTYGTHYTSKKNELLSSIRTNYDSYFADHEFLCILYEEPPKEYTKNAMGKRVEVKHSLFSNKFIGFKRVVLSDAFLNGPVRRFWEDTRKKIFDKTLTDVIQYRKDGSVVLIKSSGEVSSAPNFMKSIQNEVFMRGSGGDSSSKHKTETVNGIKMLPQYVWIKGKTIVDEILNPTQSKVTVYKMTPDYGVQVITDDKNK